MRKYDIERYGQRKLIFRVKGTKRERERERKRPYSRGLAAGRTSLLRLGHLGAAFGTVFYRSPVPSLFLLLLVLSHANRFFY
jgi:hypothetical protein